MRIRALAAQMVETPALAVARRRRTATQTPGVEVGPARAVIMNVAVVREQRALLGVELRQRAGLARTAGPCRGACTDWAGSPGGSRWASPGRWRRRRPRRSDSGSAEGIPPQDAQEPIAMTAAALRRDLLEHLTAGLSGDLHVDALVLRSGSNPRPRSTYLPAYFVARRSRAPPPPACRSRPSASRGSRAR